MVVAESHKTRLLAVWKSPCANEIPAISSEGGRLVRENIAIAVCDTSSSPPLMWWLRHVGEKV